MRKKDLQNCTIIDTYGWVEYFSDGPMADQIAPYVEKAEPQHFFTPTIIIYKVYKIIRSKYSEEEALTAIAHIKYVTTLIHLKQEIAMLAAEISLANELPIDDAIILASSKQYNAQVVTSDNDFMGEENAINFSKKD